MGLVRVDLNISPDGCATEGVFGRPGRGTNLGDLPELERGFEVTSEVAESGTIHITFAR